MESTNERREELKKKHDELRQAGWVFEEVDSLTNEQRQERKNKRLRYQKDMFARYQRTSVCEMEKQRDEIIEEGFEIFMECNKKHRQEHEEHIVAEKNHLDVIAEKRKIKHNEKGREKCIERMLHSDMPSILEAEKAVALRIKRNEQRREEYKERKLQSSSIKRLQIKHQLSALV